MSTTITIIGNAAATPELKVTASGQAVTNFNVAVANRKKENGEWVDDTTDWYRINLWGDLAEHAADTITKGMRLIIQGRLKSREWETKEGDKRTSWEITADDLGPALRYATAQVTRAQRPDSNGGQPQPRSTQATPATPAADPWATADTEAAPF